MCASSSACASMASASFSNKRPRSAAAVRDQAGKAARAAATARSMSAARASEISVITEPSCGLNTGMRPPASASTNSPSMKRRFWMDGAVTADETSARLEVDRPGFELAALVALGQIRGGVLPDQQHRALLRETLVADVGGHRGDVARLHGQPRSRAPGLAVGDLPGDLVGQLQEPLDAIVAVNDR